MNTYSSSDIDDDLFAERCGPFLLAAFAQINIDMAEKRNDLEEEFVFLQRQAKIIPCNPQKIHIQAHRRAFPIYQDFMRALVFECYVKAKIHYICNDWDPDQLTADLWYMYQQHRDEFMVLSDQISKTVIMDALGGESERIHCFAELSRTLAWLAAFLAYVIERKECEHERTFAKRCWESSWASYLVDRAFSELYKMMIEDERLEYESNESL